MSKRADFKWHQGEDLRLHLNYREGVSGSSAKTVNLSTNYALRMDVYYPATGAVAMSVPDAGFSSVLLKSTKPNIQITLPRALTLPGGAMYAAISTATTFGYDIFLRNTLTDQQVKVLRGELRVERSGTLWA